MLRVVDEAARTDTGRQRHANEDAYFARSPIYAVADGMGGAQAGEVASKIAAESFDVQLGGDNPERVLKRLALDANQRIFELARSDSSRSGMGTTLTGALVSDDEVTIVHVGDSRAYLFREGELRQLTKDHSLVEELRRQGRLTTEQAEEHPQRSIITRALGPEPDVEPDVHTHQARPGDVFLLCSDGLTSMVHEERVQQILAKRESLRSAVDKLVEEANRMGGRDNITVVCFQLDGDVPAGERERGATVEETIADLHAKDVERLAAEQAAPVPEPAVPRSPVARRARRDDLSAALRSRRWLRRTVIALAVALLLGGAGTGAVVGLHHVYFIGEDDHGLLTLYRGLPYELPGGINLYTTEYVSSVPARSLRSFDRRRLLDHELRSRKEAANLIRRLEQDQ